jgi:DNA-binding GntR family transcriptional regulator
MTVNSRRAERSGTASGAELSAIADSVRGTFQTVEGMTQSFIREAILQGIYKPGERLNQDAIAEALGVSRMPVRASLRQLEGEGLVRIYPHRGATVSVLRPHEIAEIYELRVLIEGHLLDLALSNLTDEALADLEELVGQLDGDPLVPERLERRKEFYERLYELADRPQALAMAKQLRDSVGRYLLLIRSDELHPHEDLMVHLRARDHAAAKRWLAAHLKSVSRKLQQVVPQAQDEASR